KRRLASFEMTEGAVGGKKSRPAPFEMTSWRSGLGSVGGRDAEVGDVVAFFERGDGVDVEYDAGDGGARLGDDFADVVGDGAELHAGGDVGASFDEGIPDAGAVGEDVY